MVNTRQPQAVSHDLLMSHGLSEVLAYAHFSFSCLLTGNSSQSFASMGVIGTDDRKFFKPMEFPDRVFGRLAFSTGSCTAALIGESYIVTAAHCFYEDGTFKGYEGVDFILGQYMTKSGRLAAIDTASVTSVWAGTDFGEPADFSKDIQKDWAIAKISKALGSEYGFLGISTEDESVILSQREQFTLIGYSGNRYIRHAGKDANCSVLAMSGSLYVHDCDGEQGSSGGSIVRVSDNVIVALNNAETDGANFAVPSKAFADTYRKIRMED